MQRLGQQQVFMYQGMSRVSVSSAVDASTSAGLYRRDDQALSPRKKIA